MPQRRLRANSSRKLPFSLWSNKEFVLQTVYLTSLFGETEIQSHFMHISVDNIAKTFFYFLGVCHGG